MKLAILSDIHANLAALDAVLKDIGQKGVDGIVCLGDIVGYGPRPLDCMERIFAATHHIVMGNHDAFAVHLASPTRGLREDVADGILIARNQLDSHHLEALKTLPLTLQIEDLTLVHSSLASPSDFLYIHEPGEALDHFAKQSTTWAFGGHTHLPCAWSLTSSGLGTHPASAEFRPAGPGQFLVNAGSVGQPRDNDPRACYVIFDTRAGTARWVRVHYDVARTIADMTALGMPDFSAARLLEGI